MRVKAPTSKRLTTRMREGIKKKAAAQRKKNKKMAKKDVTWKSRGNRDPGIPASFPYKEQIIEELEQGRQAEAQRREEERRQRQSEREQAGTSGPSVYAAEAAAEAAGGPAGSSADGSLAALMDLAQQAAREYAANGPADDEMVALDVEYELSDAEVDRADVDQSRKAYDKIFRAVVDASDVVLYVLDARDPVSTRSRAVEQAVLAAGGKRLLLVLNKVDLVPPHVVAQWLAFLQASFPTIVMKASAGATGQSLYNKHLLSTGTAGALMHALKLYAAKLNLKRLLVVGVIGYPNVGKSSVINALTGRHGQPRACPVGNMAGVTTAMREVKVDGKLKVLDSPGIVFPDEVSGKKRVCAAKLALLSAVLPKSIADPVAAVEHLLQRLAKDPAMADAVKAHYQIPPLPSLSLPDFTKQFLIHVARSRGRLSRGGIPNLEAAAHNVLNDWRDGRITGWVLPNASRAEAEAAPEGAAKSALRGDREPPKVETTAVVAEWAKEFDLDGLLGDDFGLAA